MTTINSFPLTTVAASTILPPIQFTYSSTTTDADPGSGKLRFNNSDPASATAVYIDNNEIGGTDVSAWLDTFDDGGNSTKRGTLMVYSSASPSIFYIYNVSGSVTDGTGYRKLTIAKVSGLGTFTDATAYTLVFIPNFAPEALTKTDDANVTLTLGGSASTALVNASSITAGWTGQLSVARGGTGSATAAAARTALAVVGTADTDVSGNSWVLDEDTMASDSATKVPTQQSVKAYVDQIVAANDAMVFKGSQDCSANPNYPAGDCGDTYRVSVAGKIGGTSGVAVEAGDLFTCLTDGTAAGDQATVGTTWTVAQTNIDGAVVGPASATSNNIATFNGTTGKLIKDSGKSLPTGDIVGTSDAQSPTNKDLSDSSNKTYETIGVALSDETTELASGTNKATLSLPYAFTVTGVYATLNTASSVGAVTVDINEAGTSILSTKLTIDASEKTSATAATAAVISDASIAANAEIGFDIDGAGSGAKGLKVFITGHRT